MAHIRRRKNGNWQVIIRKKNYPDIVRTFLEKGKGKRYYRQWTFNVNDSSVCYCSRYLFKKQRFFWINNFMKKKKRRYSRLVILDSKNDTTKEIKKILSEKHPGYEKRSKDEKMFNQACEKISFYLLDGNIKKARSVLKRIPFVPIRLSEQEIDNIIQKYKK